MKPRLPSLTRNTRDRLIQEVLHVKLDPFGSLLAPAPFSRHICRRSNRRRMRSHLRDRGLQSRPNDSNSADHRQRHPRPDLVWRRHANRCPRHGPSLLHRIRGRHDLLPGQPQTSVPAHPALFSAAWCTAPSFTFSCTSWSCHFPPRQTATCRSCIKSPSSSSTGSAWASLYRFRCATIPANVSAFPPASCALLWRALMCSQIRRRANMADF